MAKLVSMKRTKAEQKTSAEGPAMDMPAYPWGLIVRLDNDSLEKLDEDASDYKAGDELLLIARVTVAETSTRQTLVGGKSQSLELQITELCLEDPPAKGSSAADALYGDD